MAEDSFKSTVKLRLEKIVRHDEAYWIGVLQEHPCMKSVIEQTRVLTPEEEAAYIAGVLKKD